MKKKLCSGCRTKKPIDVFHRDKRNPDGRNSHCKQCRKEAREINSQVKTKVKKNTTPKIPKGAILCEKNNTIIAANSCVVDCNDKCLMCKSRQEGNLRASDNTLTHEEDKEAMIAGTWGSSSAIAVNEGHSEI